MVYSEPQKLTFLGKLKEQPAEESLRYRSLGVSQIHSYLRETKMYITNSALANDIGCRVPSQFRNPGTQKKEMTEKCLVPYRK